MAIATETLDLGDLGFDRGAHLLIRRALARLAPGQRLQVRGSHGELALHLAGWCRGRGVALEEAEGALLLGPCAALARTEQSGTPARPAESPPATWGMAARGADVELGAPAYHFPLATKAEVWAEEAGRLYAQAVAGQWDPDSAIDWNAPFELPGEVEDAVVQVMTYLVENENAALLVPARFLGQLHPHFREVMQCLAITVADEARHVEVFSRRIALRGRKPGLSSVGGQASLKTLFDTADFSVSSLLLAVLGEGSFVNLLNFLNLYAPDPVTRQICRLAARDEARHVAFGMSHLAWHMAEDPSLRHRLETAVEARYDALADTDGLNEEVFDALILLAAGAFEPAAIATGYQRVQDLVREMSDGRRARLMKLGFSLPEAQAMAERHTRNFM